MNTVYLNGQYIPMQEAKISPVDRVFLFGDEVYEVIPSSMGKTLGFDLHIARLNKNLKKIAIRLDLFIDFGAKLQIHSSRATTVKIWVFACM